jgi:WD repeat-containing protein 61
MYSVFRTTKDAHADAIWSCAWGRLQIDDVSNDDDETEEPKTVDCIVTSSVDDLIKVWYLEKDKLELQRTLTGHSLGVISVALNSDCTICASSSLDSVLMLWDLKTGTKIKSIMVGPIVILLY